MTDGDKGRVHGRSDDRDDDADERRPPRALLEAAIGSVQRARTGLSYGEGQGSRSSLQEVLAHLANALGLARPDKVTVRALVEQVTETGTRRGFTSREATRIASLALRGAGPRLPSRAVSVRLLKAIRPAKGHVFGEEFVLVIIGALGGSADKIIDRSGLRYAVEDVATADEGVSDPSSSSDGAQGDSSDEEQRRVRASKLRRRKHVDVNVQGLALRLIVLLLAPPRVEQTVSNGTLNNGDDNTDRFSLPTTFLGVSARKALDRCYGILFHFIEYQTLRPYVCHLLCTLTRRKHVKHYRIAKTLNLRARIPNDASLSSLLAAFARHFPDLLLLDAAETSTNTASGMKYLDANWLVGVYRMWQGQEVADENGDGQASAKRLRLADASNSTGLEFIQLSAIFPPQSVLSAEHKKYPINVVSSPFELGFRLEVIQLPDQLAAALIDNTLCCALLSLHTDSEMVHPSSRIESWIIGAVSEEIGLLNLEANSDAAHSGVRSETSRRKSTSLLSSLLRWCERTGGMPLRTQALVARLLTPIVWNALDIQEHQAILRLVELAAPTESRSFDQNITLPLCYIAMSADIRGASDVLVAFSRLLENWSLRDWPKMIRRLEFNRTVHWATNTMDAGIDYATTVSSVASTSAKIAATLLQNDPTSLLLQHGSISVHESIFRDGLIGLHDVTLPSQSALCLPLFSQQGAIMTLSRIFSVVQMVRELHQDFLATRAAETTENRPELPKSIRQREDAFFAEQCSDAVNDCVILFVDLVWRNSGFASVEAGNTDIGLPLQFFEKLTARCSSRGDELERVGSASHSAHLGVLMEAYANSLARQNRRPEQQALPLAVHGPVAPIRLKSARARGFPHLSHRNFRDGFLTALSDQGAVGIRGLLNATVTRFIRGQIFDESTVFG